MIPPISAFLIISFPCWNIWSLKIKLFVNKIWTKYLTLVVPLLSPFSIHGLWEFSTDTPHPFHPLKSQAHSILSDPCDLRTYEHATSFCLRILKSFTVIEIPKNRNPPYFHRPAHISKTISCFQVRCSTRKINPYSSQSFYKFISTISVVMLHPDFWRRQSISVLPTLLSWDVSRNFAYKYLKFFFFVW